MRRQLTRCWATWSPYWPEFEHRSLCRTYEINPDSLSNSYAPMSTLAARVDEPGGQSPHPASRHRRNKKDPGDIPARPKIMENHDDRSHSSGDPICGNGRTPASGRVHAFSARL